MPAPLTKATDAVVLVIDVAENTVASLGDDLRAPMLSRLRLVHQAAVLLNIPRCFTLQEPATLPHDLLTGGSLPSAGKVASRGGHDAIWADNPLVEALRQEGRADLIVCGLWLETTVTFAALPALAEGFDVGLLVDATPSEVPDARCPAMARLVQAGVVPLTTGQLLREWAETSADEQQKRGLLDLMTAASS